ncbi:MAG: N-acetyltransferase family protein [Dehalococcoidia bacterium]
MPYQIERVEDLEEHWPDLWRLFQGIVDYHEPLTGERLQSGAEEAWRAHLTRQHGLVLLVRDEHGRAIGMAFAEERENPTLGLRYGMLDTAYVEEAHRRAGVGQLMTEEVERWCRQRRLSRLDLTVRAANIDGTTAWRALGFRDDSIRMRKDLT